MNRATIIGNLGADPEEIAGGKGCKFSIATTEKWTDKKSGQKQERTEWHRITAWGPLGEVCMKYLTKGRQVCVVGSIRTDEYEKNGEKRYSTGITAKEVEFLAGGDSAASGGGRERRQRSSGSRRQTEAPAQNAGGWPEVGSAPFDDDDIPF